MRVKIFHGVIYLPGTYQLRAVIDGNKNNKWDTGNYFLKQLPEKIVIFATPIQIRAKWDIEREIHSGLMLKKTKANWVLNFKHTAMKTKNTYIFLLSFFAIFYLFFHAKKRTPIMTRIPRR